MNPCDIEAAYSDAVRDKERLAQENEKLRELLRECWRVVDFYGSEDRWETIIVFDSVFNLVDGDFCDAFAPDYENNRQDEGRRARAFLEKLKKFQAENDKLREECERLRMFISKEVVEGGNIHVDARRAAKKALKKEE